MKSAEHEAAKDVSPAGAVSVYCLAAMVAEEAQRHGWTTFAKDLERMISGFLELLPRDVQSQALTASFAMAMAGEGPAAPKLRLVYSRD